MTTLAAYTTASLISGYQRLLSPHKGFCCAHRVLHGHASCSQAIKLLILRYGLVRGWPLVIERFKACEGAYLVLMAKAREGKESKKNENDKHDAWWCLDIGTLPCSCIPILGS